VLQKDYSEDELPTEETIRVNDERLEVSAASSTEKPSFEEDTSALIVR
jgi:hypothetical protein